MDAKILNQIELCLSEYGPVKVFSKSDEVIYRFDSLPKGQKHKLRVSNFSSKKSSYISFGCKWELVLGDFRPFEKLRKSRVHSDLEELSENFALAYSAADILFDPIDF